MITLRPLYYVLLAAVAAFGYSLAGEFHLDDYSIFSGGFDWQDVWRPLETRPLTQLTFWANRKLGGAHPAGYHAVNLALHLACVWVLYAVLLRYLPPGAAAAGVTLFALHPLQAEAVNYVFARGTLLAALFCLLAWREWERGREWRSAGWFALALLAKEECVTFPLFLFLIRRSWKPVAVMLALSLAAGLRVLWAAAVVGGSGAGAQAGVAPLDYLAAQSGVVLRYLRLLALPWGFSFDPEVPAGGWLGWAALAALLAAVVRFWRHGWWLLGVFLLLAPSSTIFPAQDLSADRRMYLPMAALAAAAGMAARRLPAKYTAAAAVALTLLSAHRTWVWASEKRLWSEAAARAPGKIRPRLQLARASSPTEALAILEEAAKIAPNDPRIASEKGARLLQMNRPGEALAEFGRALALAPNDPLAVNNRGVALLALGQREAAEADFRRALRLDPCLEDARRNLRLLGAAPESECRR
jgi:hypothetical protein